MVHTPSPTGRASPDLGPNLQNVPLNTAEAKEIRHAFLYSDSLHTRGASALRAKCIEGKNKMTDLTGKPGFNASGEEVTSLQIGKVDWTITQAQAESMAFVFRGANREVLRIRAVGDPMITVPEGVTTDEAARLVLQAMEYHLQHTRASAVEWAIEPYRAALWSIAKYPDLPENKDVTLYETVREMQRLALAALMSHEMRTVGRGAPDTDVSGHDAETMKGG